VAASVSNLDLQLVAGGDLRRRPPASRRRSWSMVLGLMNVAWSRHRDGGERRSGFGPACTGLRRKSISPAGCKRSRGPSRGTANFDAPQPSPVGHGLTRADERRVRAEWTQILAVRNAAGGTNRAADVKRMHRQTDKTERAARRVFERKIMVPRGAPGLPVGEGNRPIGPSPLSENNSLRVRQRACFPKERYFRTKGRRPRISKASTWSGPVAAIAAVGFCQSCLRYTLEWARPLTAGGCQADHATSACGVICCRM